MANSAEELYWLKDATIQKGAGKVIGSMSIPLREVYCSDVAMVQASTPRSAGRAVQADYRREVEAIGWEHSSSSQMVASW